MFLPCGYRFELNLSRVLLLTNYQKKVVIRLIKRKFKSKVAQNGLNCIGVGGKLLNTIAFEHKSITASHVKPILLVLACSPMMSRVYRTPVSFFT